MSEDIQVGLPETPEGYFVYISAKDGIHPISAQQLEALDIDDDDWEMRNEPRRKT
jgi:hypothetical protein